MEDLTFTHSGEFDVDHVEGNTDEGVAFVDSWATPNMTVLDSGRIIVQPANAKAMIELANKRGLTYEIVGAL